MVANIIRSLTFVVAVLGLQVCSGSQEAFHATGKERVVTSHEEEDETPGFMVHPVNLHQMISETLQKKISTKKQSKQSKWKRVKQKDIDDGKHEDLSFIQQQLTQQDIKLDLDTWDDMIYSTEIFIGNPPQKIRALFDTGSSKFWVAGVKAKKNYTLHHNYYNPDLSTTVFHTGENSTSLYGAGSCSGEQVNDDIWIGRENDVLNNTKDKIIHIKNFTIGVMSENKNILENFRIDAIIGLAYSSLIWEQGHHVNNKFKQTAIFDAIIKQKALKRNFMAVSYVYKDEERNGFRTQMEFGIIDPHKYIGQIKWYPIVNQKYLTIKVDDVLFNNQSFGYCNNKNASEACYMTADTGLSYAGLPDGYFNIAFQKKILDTQVCDPKTRIGTFTFVIGNDRMDMIPSDWQGPPKYSVTNVNGKQTETLTCFPTMDPMHGSDPQKLFFIGDRMMRRYYTIFDRDLNRMGYAKSKMLQTINEIGTFPSR